MSATEHIGEKIADAIRNSGVAKTEVARRCGVHRKTIDNWITRQSVPVEKVKMIERAINMKILGKQEAATSKDEKIEQLEMEKQELTLKYLRLLEKHNKLLEEIRKDNKG